MGYLIIVGTPVLFFYLAKFFHSRKLEIIGLSLLCILLGLRYEFGADYPAYYLVYNSINILGDDKYKYTEPAYYYLNVLFGSLSFNTMLFFIAIVTLTLFYSRIKNFNNRTLILLIFLTYSSSYLLQIVALRQGIAPIIFFYSIEYINQKEFKKYAFGIFIATLFHNSAALLILVYFLKNITRKQLYIVLIFILFISNQYVMNYLYSIISSISLFSIYMQYGTHSNNALGTGLGYILRIFIVIFLIYYYNRTEKTIRIYYLLFIISYFVSFLGASGISVLGRFNGYFLFFAAMALPEIIRIISSKRNTIYYQLLLVFYLLTSFTKNIYDYNYSTNTLVKYYLSDFKFIIFEQDRWKNETRPRIVLDKAFSDAI